MSRRETRTGSAIFRTSSGGKLPWYKYKAITGIINPIPGLNPIAWWRLNTGIVITGSGVSSWADQSGNGHDLLQSIDANRPQKQGDGTILFDGVTFFLKCSPFTLNQPFTICLALKQIAYTLNRIICDGNVVNSTVILQSGSNPNIRLFGGAAENVNATLGIYHAITAEYNGISSSINVDATTKTTGNAAGAGNAAGFTLGSGADGTSFTNIQIKEGILFNSALSDANIATVNSYLVGL